MKTLSHLPRGGDPLTLLLLYKSFVRSILIRIVFSTEMPAHSILWNLYFDAVRATPVAVLQVETKMPPLCVRRSY